MLLSRHAETHTHQRNSQRNSLSLSVSLLPLSPEKPTNDLPFPPFHVYLHQEQENKPTRRRIYNLNEEITSIGYSNHLTHCRRHMIGLRCTDASRRPLREPATGSGTRLTGHSRDPAAWRMRRTWSRRVVAVGGGSAVVSLVTIGGVVVGGAVLAGCSRLRGGDRCPRGFLSRAAAAGRTRRVAQPLARP